MPELAGKRIFVVEDEGMIAILLEDFLEEIGCVVAASAATLEQALAQAESVDADAAVLDLNLAGRSSVDVAAVLARRGIPYLFVTGYGGMAETEPTSASVLTKPFRTRDLERALRTLFSA